MDDLLLMYLLMAAMQQQQAPAQQQQSAVDQLKGTAKLGKDAYGFGKELAALFGGGATAGGAYAMLPSAAQSSLAALTPATQAAWNAGATAAGGSLAPAATATSATGASATGAGASGALGLGLGTLAGLGAVGAFYGPSAVKYGKRIASGKANEDDMLKTAALAGGPTTAWVTPVADAFGIKIKTGKHKDQLRRDMVRDQLQKGNVIDDKFNLTLADGRKFDIGKDGGSKAYNVDFNRAGAGDAVGLANPLASIFTRGDNKLKSDFAGYLANAAMSGGDAKANIRAQYDRAGINQQQAYKMLEEQGLDTDTLRAYQHAVNQTFGNGGFDGRGGVIPLAGAAPQQSPTMIPRTGKAPPGYRPGPRR